MTTSVVCPGRACEEQEKEKEQSAETNNQTKIWAETHKEGLNVREIFQLLSLGCRVSRLQM
jgi:hypothetical protein